MRPYDRPIIIQRIDEATETWSDLYRVHARINKPKTNDQYLNAGSTRVRKTLVFEIRYFKAIEAVNEDHQMYRILYDGKPYSIEDYDDFQQLHRSVKLLGESYDRLT